MIKVVNVISDTNIGGAGKCLLAYLEYADTAAFDISVILPKNSLLKPLVEALGFTVFEIDAMSDKSLDFKAIRRLKKLFKQIKPDIVHSHASMSARIAARRAGVKIVYTRHSVFEPPARISKGLGKAINGMVNNHYCDGIIAVAEAAKQNLIATGIKESKIEVILNGVEPLAKLSADEKTAVRKECGIAPEQRVISIVARLNVVKGHEYFIRAAKMVLESGIDARFIIAGTGETEGRLKQLTLELGLEERIIFAGFVDDVTPVMNITDILVNASFGTEATSLALLEGMSIGIPAVVSDFGGNPGVITDGKNGLIFMQRNTQDMHRALMTLLNDDDILQEMKASAEEMFSERFTAEIYSANIENFYKRLLDKEEAV